jgi:hypothetical protein
MNANTNANLMNDFESVWSNADTVWSEFSQRWISTKDDYEHTEYNVHIIEKEEEEDEEEGNVVVENDDNMCSICYEEFEKKSACSTTPCGHKFHSACLFQNFKHRHECPLCREELIKSDEVVEGEEDGSDDDDEDEEEIEQVVSMKQIAEKLTTLGYTMEDILLLYFGGSNNKKDISNPRWKEDLAEDDASVASIDTSNIGSHYREFNEYHNQLNPEPKGIMERLNNDIDYILEGKIAVKYTEDTKTYAQALSQSS